MTAVEGSSHSLRRSSVSYTKSRKCGIDEKGLVGEAMEAQDDFFLGGEFLFFSFVATSAEDIALDILSV